MKRTFINSDGTLCSERDYEKKIEIAKFKYYVREMIYSGYDCSQLIDIIKHTKC